MQTVDKLFFICPSNTRSLSRKLQQHSGFNFFARLVSSHLEMFLYVGKMLELHGGDQNYTVEAARCANCKSLIASGI
jgi:hypothetical protein